MTDLPPSLAEHQLKCNPRVPAGARFPGSELIDRFNVEAAAHRFTVDPGRATRRTFLVPRALIRRLASLLSERLVVALRPARRAR